MLQLVSRLTNNSLDVQALRAFPMFSRRLPGKSKIFAFSTTMLYVDMLSTCPDTNFLQFSDEEMAWVNINHEVQVFR